MTVGDERESEGGEGHAEDTAFLAAEAVQRLLGPPTMRRLDVADNTGAKRAMCFRILKQRKEYAHLGDVIRVAIKEASPTGSIRKGQVATAVIIRTGAPIVREDGQRVHFDQNACVLVDSKLNPIGSRVFGPVPRELREKNYMKILSMAPEVV